MKPTILLVGCGSFGRHHLRILKQFDQDKKINLKGVVVATEESRRRIEEIEGVTTYIKLSDILLEDVNGVAITTPATTHYKIAKKCIKNSHLLVEKPIALNAEEITDLILLEKKYNKKIMAGHIYRFTNTLPKIREIVLNEKKEKIYFMECKFIGAGLPTKEWGALHEFLHPFDIFDYLIGEMPQLTYCTNIKINPATGFEEHSTIFLEYSNAKAHIEVGWAGREKQRNLTLRAGDINIYCDLLSSEIRIAREKEETIDCGYIEPLKAEIERFIDILSGTELEYPDTGLALRVQMNIDSAYKSIQSKGVIKW